jgi:photosystem II stability/assembly factor-like uncharacterized protein
MKKIIILSIILLTSFCYSQWIRTNGLNSENVYSMLAIGNNIFAGTQNGTSLSTNAGTSWGQVLNISARSLTVSGSNIFAGTQLSGIYLSTNNGVNWIQVNNGITGYYIRAITSSGTDIFAGTTTAGVFISTNNGTNWAPINNGLTNSYIFSLFKNNSVLYAGTGPSDGGVFRSTNNGQNWTFSGVTNQFVYALTANGSNVFAASDLAGVFKSTDNGISWTQVNNGISNMFINSMAVYNNFIFAGSQSGVLVSSDNGALWTNFSQGLPNNWFYAMVTDSTYIYAGVYGGSGGVYRRPLSDLVGIKQINSNIPLSFSLSQNYPNPFNPSTTIKFSIPPSPLERAGVRLNIYDILGREITTLVNEQLKPGEYSVTWDASNYPSGVYFYKIVSGDYYEAKKMVMIK